ncbi:hypothetical protein C8J57DRAFT_1223503 [Mycena rebaudengoi]|nr:hypothetical protein C8J57DRAFT_1223503 [Mycena rebaudengoi]
MDDSIPAKGQELDQRRADIDESKSGPKSEIPLQSSTIEHTEHNQESTLSAGWKVVMPVKAILMICLALNSLYEEWAVCHTIIRPRYWTDPGERNSVSGLI